MPRSCHPEGGPEPPETAPRSAPRSVPEAPAPLDPERVLAECEMEFMRAGGPGGQHRNRRETGVRLTHRASGVVVIATERRSQAQNRALALERMVERLEAKRKKRRPRRPTKKGKGVKAREADAKKLESARKRARKDIPRE